MTTGKVMIQDLIEAALSAREADGPRIKLFQYLADAELFLALKEPANDTSLEPVTLSEQGEDHAAVFSDEETLVDFSGDQAHFCVLPGRALAQMLASAGCGMALDPGQSAGILFGKDVVAWMHRLFEQQPDLSDERLSDFGPARLSDAVLDKVASKLTGLAEISADLYVFSAPVDDGAIGDVIAIPDIPERVQASLSKAIMEAVLFATGGAQGCDVAFTQASSETFEKIRKVARHVQLQPEPQPIRVRSPGPGMDPDKPPKL